MVNRMKLEGTALAAAIACVILCPAAAFAQSSIAGLVKDTSGAVLPGVTVEAASPALIEKTRTAVTDATGQYQITNLVPGTYSVTFTLSGFNTAKREGIELTGSFTAKVDAELRVGAIEETITVSGETPVVDVQSATRERVIDRQVMDTIPAGRNPYQLGVLIPGITLNSVIQDVGGSGGVAVGSQPGISSMMIHGSRSGDQLYLQNGVSATDFTSSGFVNPLGTNPTATEEMVIDTAAGSIEHYAGGVRINIIPKDGGNVFNGTLFGSFANDALQSNNFDERLKGLGVSTGDHIKTNWDINPGFGGPLRKDRVWFYFGVRVYEVDNYAANSFINLNANKPNVWTFAPDTSQPLSNDNNNRDGQLRLSFQATPRNKVGFVWHEEVNCFCQSLISPVTSREASLHKKYPVQRSLALDWTSPLTSRLLLEAGAFYYFGRTNWDPWPDLAPGMIAVTEQSIGLLYRNGDGGPSQQYSSRPNYGVHSRAAVSYITGTHNIKVGFNNTSGTQDQWRTVLNPVAYRFNNGVPNQITEFAFGAGNDPLSIKTTINYNLGLFAQDKWTITRLTATYGLRFDFFKSSYPEQTFRQAILAPTRLITFRAQGNLNWKDASPRLSAAYDLFGNGKTALKVSLSKYLESLSTGATLVNNPNPTQNLITSTTRSWNDANRNFTPDCVLLNPAANGECGNIADANFGGTRAGTTYDPAMMSGWGRRGDDWELSAGVQHELLARVSAEVSYFRRWYGNFKVTDNLTTSASDYTRFSITAPLDARLPNGGGYLVSGLYDLNPNKFGLASNNFTTMASNYGKQTEYWHGVDVSINARPRGGVLLQGGFATGRTVTDSCEIQAKVPESVLTVRAAAPSIPYCHQATAWIGATQVKFLGSYRVPRIDTLVSATFQSIPGPQIMANYNAPNSGVIPSLGRPLSGGAANVPVNLIVPGTMFGDRLNQVDMRFAKVLRYSRMRTTLNVDLYNAFNANAVITENSNFGAWHQPTNILQARLAKFSMQFDF